MGALESKMGARSKALDAKVDAVVGEIATMKALLEEIASQGAWYNTVDSFIHSDCVHVAEDGREAMVPYSCNTYWYLFDFA